MSEYLSKKAVLESIGEAYQTNLESPDQTDWDEGYRSALRFMKRTVLSGAFDADTSEVQRLRAALVEIKQLLNENRENDGAFQSWNHMQAWKVATQALSTTTEPKQDKTCVICGTREGKYLSTANRWFCEPCTDALPPMAEPTNAANVERVKKLWVENTGEYQAHEEYLAGIIDTLNALGIKIPGINATEGVES